MAAARSHSRGHSPIADEDVQIFRRRAGAAQAWRMPSPVSARIIAFFSLWSHGASHDVAAFGDSPRVRRRHGFGGSPRVRDAPSTFSQGGPSPATECRKCYFTERARCDFVRFLAFSCSKLDAQRRSKSPPRLQEPGSEARRRSRRSAPCAGVRRGRCAVRRAPCTVRHSPRAVRPPRAAPGAATAGGSAAPPPATGTRANSELRCWNAGAPKTRP